MKCSIVIATRDKAPYLARVLHSIRIQDVPFQFEIIVVDDGSKDTTPWICDRYRVNYIRRESSSYANPGPARNIGYRAATGDVVITQSDEVVHNLPSTVELLVETMRPGYFNIASVANVVEDPLGDPSPIRFPVATVRFDRWYTGYGNYRPLFFLGAVYRSDIFAVGGNDEEFTAPGFEDDWFSKCLIEGRGLQPIYRSEIIGFHFDHPRPAYDMATMKRLYDEKCGRASEDRSRFISSGGPWDYTPRSPHGTRGNLLPVERK